MTIRIKPESALQELKGVLVVGVFNKRKLPGWLAALPEELKSLIESSAEEEKFEGDWKSTLLLRTYGKSKIRKVLLLGLGDADDFSEDRARQAAGVAAGSLLSASKSNVTFPVFSVEDTVDPVYAKAIVEGFKLSSYKFNVYKTKKDDDNGGDIKSLELINPHGGATAALKRAVKEGEIIADAVCFARDLAAHPGNVATPSMFAREARKISRTSEKIKVSVFDRAKIKRLKMGALEAVSSGSQEPPKFIILEYRGGPARGKPVALVGKGITFDSGGISLKPSPKMEEMKYDMCGAAAVLGTFKALAQLNIRRNVVGLIPATENLPSGTSVKPGDIVRSYSGKTIEIINTDAEGRLVLADALAYAVKNYKPSAVIDLATLTGAVVVALSSHATGLMTNNGEMAEKIKNAGEVTGERVWKLPLWGEFREQIKSDFADMKNVGGKGGGSITAAALLENFVDDTPWVHLDIAGTAYIDKPTPYVPKGPSGVGVRLLLEFLKGN